MMVSLVSNSSGKRLVAPRAMHGPWSSALCAEGGEAGCRGSPRKPMGQLGAIFFRGGRCGLCLYGQDLLYSRRAMKRLRSSSACAQKCGLGAFPRPHFIGSWHTLL